LTFVVGALEETESAQGGWGDFLGFALASVENLVFTPNRTGAGTCTNSYFGRATGI
jgi:hypothetical protein